MKIYIGCDHRGYELKNIIIKYCELNNICYTDCNPHPTAQYTDVVSDYTLTSCSVDYPLIALKVCKEVLLSQGIGILICGTGIGVTIAANRINRIRAALCRTTSDAELSRKHNAANVLCLGSQTENVEEVVEAFINTPVSDIEERHLRRILMIDQINSS